MTAKDYKIISSRNFSYERIAGNSLSCVPGTMLTISSNFVAKADTTDVVVGIAMQQETYPSDNQTTVQERVTMRPVMYHDQYVLEVKTGQSASVSNIHNLYAIYTDPVAGKQYLDLATAGTNIEVVDIITSSVVIVQIKHRVTPDTGDIILDNVDAIQFDLTPNTTTPAEGKLYWNVDDGTLNLGLSGGNVNLQIGQELHVPKRVKNNTAGNFTNGNLVYISGGNGSNLYVDLADNTDAAKAHGTIAMLTEDIDAGHKGHATTFGLVRGTDTQPIDTSSFTEGQTLYLGTAGAFTGTAPASPNHRVIVGHVDRVHATEGAILVNIQQGIDMNDIDDVVITSVGDNEILQYNSTSGVWENQTLAEAGILTADNVATLTNKTIDANGTGNSITNIEVADFASNAIVIESEGIASNDNDTTLPTSAAVKDYVDTALTPLANAMVYKGGWDASAGTFPGSGAAETGRFYTVSVAGTVDGVAFNINDRLIAITDNASTTTYAGNWNQLDATDAVTSVNSQTGNVVLDADDIDDTSTTNKFVTATDITKLSNLSGTNTGDQDLSGLAIKTNVLELDNTTPFTPDADYEPATKKYVDDNIIPNTDEKVKYDAGDATAGYVADKIIAGTGISVAEGAGANENKLVITSTITQATRDSLGLDTDDTVTFANLSGTNTGDQDLSGLVSKSTYDAHTILCATTDNTPTALTVVEQTVVGRATGGNISALSIDSDLSSVSANDDTIPSAKATKAALDTKQPDIQFKDEGTNAGTAGGVTVVDFVGDGVSASESGGTLTVTIAGGGSGGLALDQWLDVTGSYASTSTFTFTGDAGDAEAIERCLFTCLSSADARKIGYVKSASESGGTVTATVVTDIDLASGDKTFRVTPYRKIEDYQYFITVPGEQVADASNPQGMYYRSPVDTYLLPVNSFVRTAAAGAGAACAWNVYKGATNLFSSAQNMATSATFDEKRPNTNTVSAGDIVTLRVTSSAGATNKASDLQVQLFLVPQTLYTTAG